MKWQCYAGTEGLHELRSEWNGLLQRSATNTLFLTWEWQTAWWAAFGQGKDMHLLGGRDAAGELKVVLPVFSQETRLSPVTSLPDINIENPTAAAGDDRRRTAHLMGGSEVSDYLDVVAASQDNSEACAALLDAWAEREDCRILDLRNLPAASPTISSITQLARSRGWQAQATKEDVCPVLELAATWDEYLANSLNRKKRHELRRKMRKAEQEVDVHWSWIEPSNIDVGLQVFFELHRASDSNKDTFMSERMEGFFRGAALAAQDAGWLRLAVLRFDSHAVASYLCFDYLGDRLLYNSGFDVSSYGHLSPGIVLLGHLIDDAIESGCRRFDFLQGNERYKYDLGATDTEVWRVFVRR